jgi:hypothetical protein
MGARVVKDKFALKFCRPSGACLRHTNTGGLRARLNFGQALRANMAADFVSESISRETGRLS